jgi:hypothetical protein
MQTITLDSRFPVPDSLTPSDSTHPLQLVRTATMLQNQAAEDAKYDPPAPARFANKGNKEGFRNESAASWMPIVLLAVFFVMVTMVFVKQFSILYSILFGAVLVAMFVMRYKYT